jgi:RNA polymerase sigma factor (TIGR02999 family)
MSDAAVGEITQVLADLRAGDRSALDRLMELVYADLHKRAHFQLRSPGGTLSTTVLVHEAFLKLAASASPDWEDRRHFFHVAAQAMRQIVIDHARERSALKRGGGVPPLELDEERVAVESRAEELLEIDAALRKLAERDQRLARLVELRFFAGLSVEEIAEVLGISTRTAKRDWQRARVELRRLLGSGAA